MGDSTHYERLAARSKEYQQRFAAHEIKQRGEGRWVIAARLADGRWTRNELAEIVVLHGGELYVGGDIRACVFGQYSDSADPARVVAWIGAHTDLRYVQSKANIGMSDWRLVEQDCIEEAREDFAWMRKYLRDERGRFLACEDCKTVRKYLRDEDVEGARRALYEHGYDVHHIEGEDIARFGRVVSDRVLVAHAALNRLHNLLVAERESKAVA